MSLNSSLTQNWTFQSALSLKYLGVTQPRLPLALLKIIDNLFVNSALHLYSLINQKLILGGGVKMAEEQDGEITFSSTNSSKEQQNGEESLQNNF